MRESITKNNKFELQKTQIIRNMKKMKNNSVGQKEMKTKIKEIYNINNTQYDQLVKEHLANKGVVYDF